MIAAGTGCDRPRAAPTTTVWLAGDVHLGGQPEDGDRARAAEARLAPLRPLLHGVGIVNLEGPASDALDAPPARLANHPDALPGLRAAGVAVVGLANNHQHDGDPDAPARTRAAVRAAGLLAADPALLIRDGVRLVVAAHEVDAPDLGAALARARGQGDVLIASLHAVATPSYLPGPAVTAAVEAALAAGADVVAVHGSHALARVERRGRAVIAWGLGNLLFACDCTDQVDGLILEVRVGRGGVVDASVIPIAAGLRGAPARPSPEPALIAELLASLRSTPLALAGDRARLAAP